jgi:hypothetical protein
LGAPRLRRSSRRISSARLRGRGPQTSSRSSASAISWIVASCPPSSRSHEAASMMSRCIASSISRMRSSISSRRGQHAENATFTLTSSPRGSLVGWLRARQRPRVLLRPADGRTVLLRGTPTAIAHLPRRRTGGQDRVPGEDYRGVRACSHSKNGLNCLHLPILSITAHV